MQVIHHIALRFDEQKKAEFLEAGVELKSGAIMTSFEIAEDDPRWQKVELLTRKFRVFDTTSTRFTEVELGEARFLGMLATGSHGYPEPSDNNGYLSATFDLTDYCKTCGIGARQVAPFRLKKIPHLGKSVLQLNWVLDEFFVATDIWKTVFEPSGIGCRTVVWHKTGATIDSTVQLQIFGISDLKLDADANFETCPECGQKKYRLSLKGVLPQPSDTDEAIFKSSQYFGSGAQAFRLVMVSNSLYRRMKDARIRGINFYPCAR